MTDELEKEPLELRVNIVLMLLCACLTIVFEIPFLGFQVKWAAVVFVISFVGMCVFAIRHNKLELKQKDFRAKKTEDIRTICDMAVDEKAKELKVTKDELVLFVYKNYKPRLFIKVVCWSITILSVSFAVAKLPGYESEYGILVFLLLVIANLFTSFVSNMIIKMVYSLDEIDFYFIEPYKDVFDRIEKTYVIKQATLVDKVIESLKRIDHRLFIALLFMGLCPTVYTTLRTFFLGTLPGEWSYSIAGQLSWINLIYEVINEAIILPLYFFMGSALTDKKAFAIELEVVY